MPALDDDHVGVRIKEQRKLAVIGQLHLGASIVEARRTAPEQTRYHPGARETIKGLVQLSRRTPDRLGHMAAWIGL